jgi:hypothetical protein
MRVIGQSPVIVAVVDQGGVAVVETEGQPPVAADPDRPVPGEISVQRVRSPAWHVMSRSLAAS